MQRFAFCTWLFVYQHCVTVRLHWHHMDQPPKSVVLCRTTAVSDRHIVKRRRFVLSGCQTPPQYAGNNSFTMIQTTLVTMKSTCQQQSVPPPCLTSAFIFFYCLQGCLIRPHGYSSHCSQRCSSWCCHHQWPPWKECCPVQR